MKLKRCLTALAVTTLIASNAWATNGYKPHGIGQKAKGMGGAAIAFPQDTLAAGVNPAGMVTLGNRMDVGIEYFRPQRSAEISGSLLANANGRFDGDDTENFFIPEFGYNRMINDRMSLGVSVFGNGGMNTNYGDGGVPLFNNFSDNRTGIDLAQLFIVPAFSWKMGENHSFGIGVNLAGQRIRIRGIGTFVPTSIHPDSVNDNGYSYSYGWGLRAGWLGKVHERVTLGITGQTRTWMGSFDEYEGVFADEGNFDIPGNVGVGIAVKATSKLTIAADVEKIFYSKINSVGNGGPTTNEDCFPIGTKDGCGFGWQDQWIYKLGLSYELNPEWTLRAGYNYGASPINNEETLFNILAPATVEHHLTLGGTWNFKPDMELTFHYMHALSNEIEGSNSIPPGFPPSGLFGGEADIKMHQNSFGIAFGWKL